MALATIDNLEARGVDISDEDRVTALLEDASAAVVGYTGQTFTRGERTKHVWPTYGYFELRGRNVTGVSAVDDNGNAVTLSQVGLYRWYAATCRHLVVTYTEGWDEVPADIVAVVCSMAARAVSVESAQVGHSQDTAGPFSFTIGSAAANGAVGMMADERRVLDRYRRTGTVHGAVWAGGLL